MPLHKNRLENQEEHHLYEIQDDLDNDVFKYGISSDPIEEDGLSSRLRKQIDFMNLVVNWTRFFGRILIRGIKGRAEAKRLETEHIDDYEKQHGRRPRGNRRRK